MTDWTKVAPLEELPPGAVRTLDVDGTQIAVFNVDGNYYAIEDSCSHDGGVLSSGTLEGCELVCPRHGAHFSLKNGVALSPPAYEPVAVFPVRVVDGMLQVRDDRWD